MTITTALLSGYGSRKAYAGYCTPVMGLSGTYTCTEAVAVDDEKQRIAPKDLGDPGVPLTITTESGFGIDVTSMLDALSFEGTGGLSFTDNYLSTISGGESGIYALNETSGNLSITTTGSVSGGSNSGIYAKNYSGTGDLTITAAAVNGSETGIRAKNNGDASTLITSTGTVTGGKYRGIDARNGYKTGDLTITAADVLGKKIGIFAYNYGYGATSITTTGTVTGTDNTGIQARNGGNADDLTITAADIFGGEHGIYAFNEGRGATSITAVVVFGGKDGISARNRGTGATSSTTTGTVTGIAKNGI